MTTNETLELGPDLTGKLDEIRAHWQCHIPDHSLLDRAQTVKLLIESEHRRLSALVDHAGGLHLVEGFRDDDEDD